MKKKKLRTKENNKTQLHKTLLCVPLTIAIGGFARICFNNSNIRIWWQYWQVIWKECFPFSLVITHHYTLKMAIQFLKKPIEINKLITDKFSSCSFCTIIAHCQILRLGSIQLFFKIKHGKFQMTVLLPSHLRGFNDFSYSRYLIEKINDSMISVFFHWLSSFLRLQQNINSHTNIQDDIKWHHLTTIYAMAKSSNETPLLKPKKDILVKKWW